MSSTTPDLTHSEQSDNANLTTTPLKQELETAPPEEPEPANENAMPDATASASDGTEPETTPQDRPFDEAA